ncbi:thiamine phosphate synthase [Sulfurihydrogenibium subterraneum]|uniref:thiamine phosphate synthase n=1 Tax=Sulfurihydrogenibium subterraneum TaxID=171121 RepID=UPI0004901235|nr:thiamine phosphate synthase [Sulfurihydrogenibium subterraneum]
MKLRGLYVITDEKLTPYDKMLDMVEKALKGGASIVQLRDKNNSDEFLIPYSKELKDLCHKYNAIFIVNDRVDLALKVDADGVHIGEEDSDVAEVREKTKGKIMGVSCYGSVERALQMQDLGADYVAFGSFYPSPTKPKSRIVPKSVISDAKKVLKIPICVIGGLTVENSKELIDLGADLVAVISDVWTAPDIEERCKQYIKLFN